LKFYQKKFQILYYYLISNLLKMSIGVPIKLLHEAENHVVTVELKTGELFRGYLMEAEVIKIFIYFISFYLRKKLNNKIS